MSLSFRRRDRDGNVRHYFIPFDPMSLIALVGIVFGFVFTLALSFRNVVLREPLEVATAIVVSLLNGCGFS